MPDRFDNDQPTGRGSFDPYEGLEDLTGSEPLLPLEEPTLPGAAPPRSPLLTGLIVLLLLIVLSIAIFQFLRDDGEDAAASTTLPGTTEPADNGSGTTAATTTPSSTPPASTTAGSPQFTPYEASGEAVPIDELQLAVDAIGPIELGSPAAEAIGRLIASFGAPDEDSGPVTSTGAYGACDGDTERIVRFGALVAVVVIDPDGTETFAGYRLDLSYGGLEHDSTNMATLSGLGVGNSIRQLEEIYSSFDVQFLTDPELGDVFELRNSSGSLLLWGPVSSSDVNGFVRGIYSPDACDRF